MALTKSAKKAAKKAPKKHEQHKHARNARRAFEHLGRVEAIVGLAEKVDDAIGSLLLTAQSAFDTKRYEESADLLRAAEHLAFASIAKTEATRISPQLAQSIHEEFDHLLERAEEHGQGEDASTAIRRISSRILKNARQAMLRMQYHAGLELARAAEALSHLGPYATELMAPDCAKRLSR